MIRNKWILTITLSLASVVYNQSFGQEGEAINKQQKRITEKKEENAKESEKARQEGIERHMDNQDKETKKRMKKNKKKANRINSGKKEPFYKKWFIKD